MMPLCIICRPSYLHLIVLPVKTKSEMNMNIENLKLKDQIPPQTKMLTYDSVESLSVSFGQLYKFPYL